MSVLSLKTIRSMPDFDICFAVFVHLPRLSGDGADWRKCRIH